MQLSLRNFIKGDVTGYYIPETPGVEIQNSPWRQATPKIHNDVLYGAAPAVQRLLTGLGSPLNYKVNGAYIEFDNSGSAVNPTPTVTRADGLSYYAGLSAPQDYLRVGISAVSEENTDNTKYDLPNRGIFHIYTAGSLGVGGLTFSDVANSRVFGGALVAMQDPDDAEQDIVLARFYFAAANQLEKLVGSQIGLRWGWTIL